MKVYLITLKWKCEECGHTAQTGVDDLVVSGVPICPNCPDVEMQLGEDTEAVLVPTSEVTLNWKCPDPECGKTASTPLKWTEKNGTATCECDTDMVLDETVEIKE